MLRPLPLVDRFDRTIDTLRVAVTDRCDLRCRYCVPASTTARGLGTGRVDNERAEPLRDDREKRFLATHPLSRDQLLSFEEIREVVAVVVRRGVKKVRLTGGEPLVRRGLVELVRQLRALEGDFELVMTTNGQRLADLAPALADAGLGRVNVSLDAMDPMRFRYITRGGDVWRTLRGIQAARRVGLTPIKLNCVVGDRDEPDARDVARFAAEEGFEVRFIRRMNLAAGVFEVVEGGTGGDCARCNRLRLTADGKLRPCLLSDIGFSVRQYSIEKALELSLRYKPARGVCTSSDMYQIGG